MSQDNLPPYKPYKKKWTSADFTPPLEPKQRKKAKAKKSCCCTVGGPMGSDEHCSECHAGIFERIS